MRFSIIAGALVFLAACNEADQKGSARNADDSARLQTANSTTTNAAKADSTSIQWLDSVNQTLPKVKEGAMVEISWRFKNTGTRPLVVENVTAGCGCTVPEKPEAPIAPGEEGVIRAKFDSKTRVGSNTKEVTMTANTGVNSMNRLSFTVEVEK